jgi:LysR family transcriptional activator of nhaA
MTNGLNYHHLLYFATVVREGACPKRPKAAPLAARDQRTGQALEAALGERLFQRPGSPAGAHRCGPRVVEQYAAEIFAAGSELLETLRSRPVGARAPARRSAWRTRYPSWWRIACCCPRSKGDAPVQMTCTEDDPEQLLARLATHALDVVISDAPAPPHVRVKVFNHLLGDSGTTFFRRRRRWRNGCAGGFHARSPARPCCCRRSTRRFADRWSNGSRRKAFDRSSPASSKTRRSQHLRERGTAVFAAPTAIEKEVRRSHRWASSARTPVVRERYYAFPWSAA